MKNKKTADDINLEFHHICLDNAKKSKFDEFLQQERIFKRKYSWCLSRNKQKNGTSKAPNNMNPKTDAFKSSGKSSKEVCVLTKRHSLTNSTSTKGDNSCSTRHSLRTPSIIISRCSDESTNTSMSVDSYQSSPMSSCRNKSPSINISRCSTASTRNTLSPPHFPSSPASIESLESRFSPDVLLRRRKSSEELLVRPRTSIHEIDSDDRVIYLEKLWSNVFGTEKEVPPCRSTQKGRRPKTPLKESFKKIVLGQFEDSTASSSTCTTTRLPDIPNKGGRQGRNRPDGGNISTEFKNIHQEEIETIKLDVDEKSSKEDENTEEYKAKETEQETVKDGEQETTQDTANDTGKAPNTARSENEANSDDAKDSQGDEADMLKKIQDKSNGRGTERRRSSLNVLFNKPSFMTFSMRERSLSVDHEISRNLWRTGLLSLQTVQRRGRQKLISCMKLAVSKDKDKTLKGKRWRDDLKRCRYLRIPEDSPYMRPDTSDSESD